MCFARHTPDQGVVFFPNHVDVLISLVHTTSTTTTNVFQDQLLEQVNKHALRAPTIALRYEKKANVEHRKLREQEEIALRQQADDAARERLTLDATVKLADIVGQDDAYSD